MLYICSMGHVSWYPRFPSIGEEALLLSRMKNTMTLTPTSWEKDISCPQFSDWSIFWRNSAKSGTYSSQFAKLSLYFGKCRAVCLSASLTHPGVTLANFSPSDPWHLSPRRRRVPIALTQTLGLSRTPPPAAPCVFTSRI